MSDRERIERLGEGAFGEVWREYDHALGRFVAVKYVRPERIHDPTEFYNEPRALVELRHPHVVEIYDAGHDERGTLYIAMEYIRGGSLEQSWRGQPVILSRAVKYLAHVCRALEYAHNREYLHRDIKPANILVDSSKNARLSDFGLASRVPRGVSASAYGYIAHLSPEAITHGTANVLTDIYALGVTAYRLINGDSFLPDYSSEDELQDMICAGVYPDRSRHRPFVPEALRRAVNRCMHRQPESRFPSAASFRHALERQRIRCDWDWVVGRRQVKYKTRCGEWAVRCVVRKKRSGAFDVVTTRRRLRERNPRHVSRDCAHDLSEPGMKRFLRQVLTRYVTHGK